MTGTYRQLRLAQQAVAQATRDLQWISAHHPEHDPIRITSEELTEELEAIDSGLATLILLTIHPTEPTSGCKPTAHTTGGTQ